MRYALHDGPGVRTTVFFKGCPLHCWWCHNPESQAPAPELMLWPERCIGCGECLRACPNGAVQLREGILVTDRALCAACLRCAAVCHAEARKAVGRTASVAEVMAEVKKDRIFFDESGGGVTFSGGEPLLQPAFLGALLRACREREIHTAVETSGFGKWSDIQAILGDVDLFLYDLKLMDEHEHLTYTGVANGQILTNLTELSRHHANIVVRVPVIPGVNDSEANLQRIGEFVRGLSGVREIHLLPYHKAGTAKFERLSRQYRLPGTEPPDPAIMHQLAGQISAAGIRVKIGG